MEIDLEDLRLYCPHMMNELQIVFAHDHIEDVRAAVKYLLETNVK